MKTRSFSSLEQLEARIAPASVSVNATAKTATWIDFDGDAVTLKWTSVQPPAFATTDDDLGLRMDKITLNPGDHSQGSFTLSVKAAKTGDGRVDLGRIDATNTPLKSWNSPAATVAEIDAGNGTQSIGKLTIGALGTVHQSVFNNPGGEGSSILSGAVSTVLIKGDIGAASLAINMGNAVGKSVVIQGSLRGDAPGSGALAVDGFLSIGGGSLGLLSIGGSIVGGETASSGGMIISAKVGLFQVKGSVLGGSGGSSGTVFAVNPVARMSIGGDVQGSSGSASGSVLAITVASFTVGGSILGGSAEASGIVSLVQPGTVMIKGSIKGGFGTDANTNTVIGMLQIQNGAKSITVGGDLVAGTFDTGTKVNVNGAIVVNSGNVGSITVKGSILGNEGTDALILARGQAPDAPGNFNAIGRLTIGGSVSYGYIAAGHALNTNANNQVGAAENPDAGIGSVTVGGNWFHSSLSAGINDAGSTGVASSDTRDAGEASRMAVLGPVIIKGRVFDNPSAGGVSGFAAEKIASITVGGVKVFQSGDPARSLDTAGFVDIVEI